MDSKLCNYCPRECNADRSKGYGACRVSQEITVAKIMLHMWEEPCISGQNGSGAIFFSGCSLGCIFCQNHAISKGQVGDKMTVDELVEVFWKLKEQGANNINLVTADHFVYEVATAIEMAKKQGFDLPFVYNCSGYEKVEQIKRLDGLIDIYLPDFKYMKKETAGEYSGAGDYPIVAKAAIDEMVRQCADMEFFENGIMKKGVIVRHLLLPGHVKEAESIVSYLYETYQDTIIISLMSQYTPVCPVKYPELNRKVTKREYDRLLSYVLDLGVQNVFIQEGDVAKESFIPDF